MKFDFLHEEIRIVLHLNALPGVFRADQPGFCLLSPHPDDGNLQSSLAAFLLALAVLGLLPSPAARFQSIEL